ncbi:DNA-binding protein [Robertmurraya yapensis]|uniref:DNA-binding protein n=2 Tax=Bacillaceae TaxID=186817 RepID=A0A431VYV3_9BACI|nr:small multi-drug export protein [Bacillus yapensis]RTR28394.1 DNA-binding protein [Bacillus yapensis]TKS94455.1 DNA-binding protein [Bacillus yapensis]
MILEYLQEWSYFAVFFLSAIPWVESAAVVVLAIAFGLSPIPSTILAFAGNWLVVVIVVLLFDRWQEWRNRKRAEKGIQKEDNKKRARAHGIFVKYGLPGLALLGPLLIGTEIAAAFAMIFKAPRKNVLTWMTVSLALWTILFATATYYGFNILG